VSQWNPVKVIVTQTSEVSTDHRNGIELSQRTILSKVDALRNEEIEFGLNEKTSQVESK
jgi:hypothetical protein